ncbi:putative transcription factor SEF1 [Lachancea thermotolerans]
MSGLPQTSRRSSEASGLKRRSSAEERDGGSARETKRKNVKSEELRLPNLTATGAGPQAGDSGSKSGGGNGGGSGGSEDKGCSSDSKAAAGSTGHRPVTSCTHCRQHKIKCNASDNFPAPCSRCERMGLRCEIDPRFRPKKGSQLQSLRNDVDELKLKIEYLTHNESLIAQALQRAALSGAGQHTRADGENGAVSGAAAEKTAERAAETSQSPHSKVSVQTYLASEPRLLSNSVHASGDSPSPPALRIKDFPSARVSLATKTIQLTGAMPTSAANGDALPPVLQIALKRHSASYASPPNAPSSQGSPCLTPDNTGSKENSSSKTPIVATTNTIAPLPSPQANIDEFVLGEVTISIAKANELHAVFVEKFLPYFPIMYTNSATELYSQSQLLFWTVMLTACLSEPEPTLYIQLASLIKQLAIETCWIRTPRSTHISQALLILCNWPLPNQKVLDDCSYRFVGLAKSLSYQLGLHRGRFMSEFTRTQTSMPDAEKWRTRTWLGIFFTEQCWASILGLPPTSQNDYLVERARLEEDEDAVPRRFRQLIILANFQAKLCNMMGSSVVSPDGLTDARERAGCLAILERELKRLNTKFSFEEDTVVEMYYLYVKLMICCFAFLPGTPTEDQSKYVTEAYLCATKVVTLLTKLLESANLIQLPIYVRQSVTYSALILFKLQLTPLLLDKYVDSARQSIVTVHRLYRNQLTAWTASVENDISRTASVLEKLNFVLISQPEIFIEEEGIITRMRSHLTGTLFYDLVWCIHEARRRQNDPNYREELSKRLERMAESKNNNDSSSKERKLFPLPFYNQISKEDFETITQTTPGGTTVTTLIPTKNAIQQAKQLAESQGDQMGPIRYINGIPISVLEETGSVKLDPSLTAQDQNAASAADSRNAAAPPNLLKTSVTTEDIMPKSPLLFDQPMQRSASTPSAETPGTARRAANVSSSIATGNTDSLFSMNTSAPLAASLAKAMPLEAVAGSPPLHTNSYSSLNVFLAGDGSEKNESAAAALMQPQQSQNQQASDLDNFFQQQSAGWIEGNSSNDDFLGWFDINMAPEF